MLNKTKFRINLIQNHLKVGAPKAGVRAAAHELGIEKQDARHLEHFALLLFTILTLCQSLRLIFCTAGGQMRNNKV